MVSQANVFIAVAASVLVAVIILMLVARRFKGQREIDRTPEQRPRRPGLTFQLQPSNRPIKPYNPFSDDELQLLHTVTLTKEDIAMLASDGKIVDGDSPLRYASPECSICLLAYEAETDVRVLSCGHVYHVDCVDSWLTKRSARCPICKLDIRSELGLQPRQEVGDCATQAPAASADLPETMDGDGSQNQEHHHVVDVARPPTIHLHSA